MNEEIRVWRFQDAPEELRNRSESGGDEDWLALFPPGYDSGNMPGWIRATTFDAGYDPQIIPLECGRLLVIGGH